MDTFTPAESIEQLREVIRSLEHDEHRFYIAIDLAHQLIDEILEASPENEEEQ